MCRPPLSICCDSSCPHKLAKIMPVVPSNSTRRQVSRPKKSVRFHQTVHVAPFPRSDADESASQIWYSGTEIALMRAEGRVLATSYSKLGEKADRGLYRGFEKTTYRRQRQTLLSNRCAIYAYQKGMDTTKVSSLYKQCNQWSSDVAFVQAIHDCFDAACGDETSFYNDKSMKTIVSSMPHVASMIPPQDNSFAIQGFLVLQEEKRNKKRKVQKSLSFKRKISPFKAFEPCKISKHRSTITGMSRNVRQRIC